MAIAHDAPDPEGLALAEGVAVESLCVRLQPALCPTDEQFFQFCGLNRELRIERTATGEVTVMPPAGWESARRNAAITAQLQTWATADGTGLAADSSAGYILPSGAIRSPDASWVRNSRLETLSAEQRSRFLPLAPDFVIELRSPTDRLSAMQEKMLEYAAGGVALGWLIDPVGRMVLVYRPGSDAERLIAPASVSGDPVLPGLRLRLEHVWQESARL